MLVHKRFFGRDLSKTRNPKSPEHRYFDTDAICVLGAGSSSSSSSSSGGDGDGRDGGSGRSSGTSKEDPHAAFEPFVQSYSSYVIYRGKTFTSKYVLNAMYCKLLCTRVWYLSLHSDLLYACRFLELKNLNSSTPEKKSLRVLKSAQKCIDLGYDLFIYCGLNFCQSLFYSNKKSSFAYEINPVVSIV
jgi:hypothetical protein